MYFQAHHITKVTKMAFRHRIKSPQTTIIIIIINRTYRQQKSLAA